MLQRSPRPILLFLAFAPVLSAAEEVTSDEEQAGLTVAVALEQVLTRVIADAEVSVVPIAIFRTGGVAESDRGIGGRGFRVADPESTPSLDAVPDIYATGVVVSDQGLVLTNHHVIRGAEKGARIFIRTPGRPLWDEMRIKASDPYGDLAILEGISPDYARRKWRPMPLGDGSALKKGQIVISLGNPFALARDGEVSAGWGIVSNLRRRLPAESNTAGGPARPTMHHLGTLIQTDAKLNLGASGGPLLNLRGEMVGLTTALSAIEGHERAAGYAVAVDAAFRRALGLLMQGREVEYGFMGIRPGELKERERAAGRRGVRVQSVVNGGPAVGHVRRMDVITHIDDQPVESLSQLLLTIGRSAAGEEVELQVTRNDRRLMIPVTLTKNRVWGETIATAGRPSWRGIRVDVPAAMRPFADVWQIPVGCVVVREVVKGSAAEKAGIRPGMHIDRVGDSRTEMVETFYRIAGGLQGAVEVEVRDLRGGPADRFEIGETP
ncbi:MAG: trypsin-like peptidase domain-containing protein [Pirellulales bacterium]|nr:trypsin-like peptidase domain-containing protein [Pirellulales bacterium]